MKIGKVFDKLAARPAVRDIYFYQKDGTEATTDIARCSVYLQPGYTSDGETQHTCNTAHAARLFIDAAKLGVAAHAAPEPAPAFAQPDVPEVIQLALESAVAARVEERKAHRPIMDEDDYNDADYAVMKPIYAARAEREARASSIKVDAGWLVAACQSAGVPVPDNCNGDVLVPARTIALLAMGAAA